MKLSKLINGIAAAGLMLSTSMLSTSVMAKENISVPKVQNEYDRFAKQVLIQVLEKASYRSRPLEYDRDLSRNGLVESLKYKDIDVAWLPASDSVKEGFTAVQIPIFKDVLSYYQIQTNDDRKLQSTTVGLTDIQQMHIGLLRDDANIQKLSKAGFKVSGARNIEGLQSMLEGGRFDIALMPLFKQKGIEASAKQSLSSTQVILAANPYFFTVHQSRPDLARAIQIGLQAMYQDGSMQHYMNSVPWMVSALNKLESGELQVLKIDNPNSAYAAL